MGLKKSFEIRFPATERGWIDLEKRVTENKKPAAGARPKISEIRAAGRASEKHHRLAEQLRRQAKEQETLEQKARVEVMDLLRRRARNVKSGFRDPAEAKAALIAEGYDVVDSAAVPEAAAPAP